MRPIKCSVYTPAPGGDPAVWRARLAGLDASGLTSVAVSDHFSYAPMDIVAALSAIAASTSRLRIMSLLFCNDYRHPVITHKAAVTLDVLSEGRLDFGIGAGFLAAEYAAGGLAFDDPAVRVGRLEESLDVILGLFGGEPVRHAGRHYTVDGLTGNPLPVQRPHPPLLIGGGNPRVLRLAGRRADIVGVHSSLRAGTSYDAGVIEDLLPERIARKVGWARQGAEEAGRDPDALDYLYITWTSRVVERPGDVRGALGEVAARYGVSPDVAARSVGILVGTAEQCVEQVLEHRERFGLNYVNLGTADMDMLGPLVEALRDGA